jgi:hypothetical protein
MIRAMKTKRSASRGRKPAKPPKSPKPPAKPKKPRPKRAAAVADEAALEGAPAPAGDTLSVRTVYSRSINAEQATLGVPAVIGSHQGGGFGGTFLARGGPNAAGIVVDSHGTGVASSATGAAIAGRGAPAGDFTGDVVVRGRLLIEVGAQFLDVGETLRALLAPSGSPGVIAQPPAPPGVLDPDPDDD